MADPSKIEKKVMEQVQQRVTNHEMRNLARKLTPAEKKEKKKRKLQEDTSRQVGTNAFEEHVNFSYFYSGAGWFVSGQELDRQAAPVQGRHECPTAQPDGRCPPMHWRRRNGTDRYISGG